MVVELLLPVWHLTSTLAAAKRLDALQDNKDPETYHWETGDGCSHIQSHQVLSEATTWQEL